MAKNSITDYSKTASLNTDIQSVDIDEGCLPSGINNAIRELMADLAAMNDGTVSLTSPAFTSVDINGGTIDGAVIGGASAAAGTFTTGQFNTSLNVDGTVTADGVELSGTSVNLTLFETDQTDLNTRFRQTAGDIYIQTIVDDSSSAKSRLGIDHATGDISFYEDTGTTAKLFWDASAERLGIGTSSPSYDLDVNKSTSGAAVIGRVRNTSSTSGANAQLKLEASGNNFTITNYPDADTANANRTDFISTASNSYFSFSTNNAERMRIDSSGNVGIGTTSPSSALEVAGQVISTNSFKLTANVSTPSGNSMFRPASNTLAFATNSTERMRIDSSGNVGIGTSSPSTPLHISATSPTLWLQGSTSGQSSINLGPSTDGDEGGIVYDQTNNTLQFRANGSERMRLVGNSLYINQTTGISPGVNGWSFNKISGSSRYGASGTTSNVLTFYTSSGVAGRISVSGTTTSYQTSSDYRLKENISDITDGITRVKQLQPKRFNFIHDADTTVDGFLAHEAQTVVPEAISGTKDAVETWTQEEIDEGNAPAKTSAGDNKLDNDGNTIPDYQGIDQAKLVPLLTAALQEAITKIEDLEARVATLEGN